jgi:putative acetyltransferase
LIQNTNYVAISSEIIVRSDGNDPDFLKLVAMLDQELAVRDGDDHAFYAQFNKTNLIPYSVVLYYRDEPIGCGALKPYDDVSFEVKRMYVVPRYRGLGYASEILKTLERWAAQLDMTACVLETGKMQPEAIALYLKSGYKIIPNYGQYVGIENSVCFRKVVSGDLE